MNNKMRNLIDSQRRKVDEMIDKREQYYEDRSDKWKESEKGEYYFDKTNELQEVSDNLEMTIGSLDIFIFF